MTPATTPTAGELARDVARRLEHAGVPPAEAALDAELLARTVLGWDRARWIVEARTPAPPELRDRLEPFVLRRERREPMAYILGRCEFWGLEFEVDPRVLIPRPETEIVVEQALARIGVAEDVEIADIGTGSGCLAVALAVERPRARVVATDISAAALEVSRSNAVRHGVSNRVALVHTSLPNVNDLDLIVSNPPYVPLGDRAGLSPEVRDHEPAQALFAGEDGLDVIRWLVEQSAQRALCRDGWLIFEFGFGQADAVRALLQAGARSIWTDAMEDVWTDVEIVSDLQGIPRTAVARKSLDLREAPYDAGGGGRLRR